MERVIVIGCPGAGKSTFARALHQATDLPLFYLDQIWHRPDKSTLSEEEFDAALANILKQPRWIIDGNYLRTMEMRLERCDTVFLLDYPLELCLEGAAARLGTAREDMPWIETEFDPEFRQWIEDFPKIQLPRVYELLDSFRQQADCIVFRSRQQADDWLREWKKKRENENNPA